MAPKIISSYYTFDPQSALQPEGINGDLMTHLIVGWAGVDGTTGRITVSPSSILGFKRCVQLKSSFPHLKVMVVCGGGATISRMANHPKLISSFVSSCVELLESCELDGLDIDWEFPVWHGEKYDRQNFVLLLKGLREAFGSKYLLTTAVAAQKLIIDPAYDVPAMEPFLDFINLMCYDFNMFQYYNIWANYNSPLFVRPEQKSIFGTLNTSWAAEYWLSKGMPRNKIVVGIPTYARKWNLLSSCWHSLYAVCVGGGSGTLTYPDVMDILVNGDGIRVFDQYAQVPYLYKGRLWISYEDEESVRAKANWVKKEDYGGAMVFSVDNDDFLGVFSITATKFPLMTIIASIIRPGSEQNARSSLT